MHDTSCEPQWIGCLEPHTSSFVWSSQLSTTFSASSAYGEGQTNQLREEKGCTWHLSVQMRNVGFFFICAAISKTCNMLGPERPLLSNFVQKRGRENEAVTRMQTSSFPLSCCRIMNEISRQLGEEIPCMCARKLHEKMQLSHHSCFSTTYWTKGGGRGIWPSCWFMAFDLQRLCLKKKFGLFHTDFFKYLLWNKCSHYTIGYGPNYCVECSWSSGNGIQSPEFKWFLVLHLFFKKTNAGTKHFIQVSPQHVLGSTDVMIDRAVHKLCFICPSSNPFNCSKPWKRPN